MALLDGLLEPLSRCLDAESARQVVAFRIATPVQERMQTLSAQANEGTLTEDERSECEALVNVSDLISILKLKVRRHIESSLR